MDKVSIINRRILSYEPPQTTVFSDESRINLSDTVFEFLSEECDVDRSWSSASSVDLNVDDDDEKEIENIEIEDRSTNDEDDSFWKTQHQLLQSTICRTSSFESRIRRITKEAVKEAQQCGNGACLCGGRTFGDDEDNMSYCRKCLMEHVLRRLQIEGFDAAICKSKWRSSHDIPSGEHTFLDVLDKNSNPKKGQAIRVIIELNFRGEFEMARANEEYDRLIRKLPEIFVGKIERLAALIKILCSAAKKCMKEKKMHLGPWRKHRYMQAKWLKTCERSLKISSQRLESNNNNNHTSRVSRPRRSMLTVDLMENHSSCLYRPVEVV